MCVCCAAYATLPPPASRLNKNVYKYFCLIITAFVAVFLAVVVFAVFISCAVDALVMSINIIYYFIS